MTKKIYLDNAATTKVDEKVLKAMLPYFDEKYANASSRHIAGVEAKEALENSRKVIAKSLNADSDEIIFTSGGTEGNNFVLKGLFLGAVGKDKKNHFVTTKIEHDCILRTCEWLEKQGAKVTYLDVDPEGFVDVEELKKSITPKTALVSIIHANNEIGTLQNLEEIGKICKEKKTLFHTDACQSFTKVPLDVKKFNLDFVTLNAHKIHGPKGVGAVYVSRNLKNKIVPLLHGGGHENNLRSGTENVSGAVGFAKAVEVSSQKDVRKMTKLRDKLIEGILEIPETKLNGPSSGEVGKRLCNNVNVSFNNIDGEAMGGYLENFGIYVSTGSACMSHSQESSHVLRALGLKEIQAQSSLRISISKYTTEKDVEYVLEKIKKVVEKLRKVSPLLRAKF